MKSTLIGITVDEEVKPTYSIYPWYALRKNYSESLEKVGATTILLPNNPAKVETYLNFLDGLLVTGGDFDVDPQIYGEVKQSPKVNIKKNRTDFELKITKLAIQRNLPILGICGGQQLLNVASGGTLIQHIPDKIKSKINHEQENPRNEGSHEITIFKESKLFQITKKNRMYVNSAHHQAVEKLGKGMTINAVAEDGIIEGIENPDLDFCIGVQWHPEFLIDETIFEY